MVHAMINIADETNRVLNIIKAKFGLRDKSQAIDLVVGEYEHTLLEPELRPEYRKKLETIIAGRHFSREQFNKLVG